MANNNKGKCQVCPKFSEARCSWCKLVFYCSKEHQKQDWPHHKETCTKKKYRMEENEQLGRHLVATEDIKPDHILFKDKPLVLSYKLDTLEYTGNKICVGCYKEIPLEDERRLRRKEDDDGRKAQIKRATLASMLVGKQGRLVQSENNENDDDEQKEKDNEENSFGSPVVSNNERVDDGGGDDEEEGDDDESDEYDNSCDEEDNDADEPEKNVCLSCRLPICTTACSDHYFHKQLECKLLREAISKDGEQRLQQNRAGSPSPTAASFSPSPEESASRGGQGKPPAKKTTFLATPVETIIASLPSSSSNSSVSPCKSNSSSNQDSVSLGTTCNNTSCTLPAPGSKNIIANISDGIRETLLRNLLYFRCLLLRHVNEGHWNELMSLQSNDEARKSDAASLEKSSRMFALIKKTLAEINHPTMSQVNKPDVHKLVGIIEINALHINISQNVEVTGVFPTFSLLEHSCIPSVKYYLAPLFVQPPSPLPAASAEKNSDNSSSGRKHRGKASTLLFELYCRSAVKLKNGDHLSVAYTNAMWNTEKRREFLQKDKNFWCECRRCNSDIELGSNFSTILCPLCKAPSVPVYTVKAAAGSKSNNNNSGNVTHEIHWKCTSAKCGKTCAGWQVKKVDTKLCEMVGKTKPSIESYKECLDRMEELVHPDYYLCCIVAHSLIQMYGHDAASVHDKKLLEEKIALCNKLLGVIKKLDPGMAVLNIYASVVFYEMHSAILAVAGAEVDDDYHILRNSPETVNLAKVYLQRCIDCFKYEFFVPENKLKILGMKKMEYLNLVMNRK